MGKEDKGPARPIGVTVLCLLQLVAVVAQLTAATLVALGRIGLDQLHGEGTIGLDIGALMSEWRAPALLAVAAALQGAIAYGLWTLRNWARMLVILLLGVNVLGDLVILVLYGVIWPDALIATSALVKGALSVWVIRYLALPHVRQQFSW